MTHNDIFDIQALQEDSDLEVKDARGRDGKGKLPESFWETYSAMANTEGGWIVLGVEQKGQAYLAHGIVDTEKVRKELWNGLNNPQKVSVNLLTDQFVHLQEHVSGKKVIWIWVPQASRKQRPVYVGANPLTGTYRRNFDGDYKCPEHLVKQMLGEQANDTRDAVLLDRFDMDDISSPTLQLYRQHFTNRLPDHPFNDYDNVEFLRNLGGWGQDRRTRNEGLTLAGLLMFGKLRSILDAVPNYIVDYQERPRAVTEMRWVDRLTTDFTWSGNLYDFYQNVIKRLYRGLKVAFTMEGDTRVDDTPVHKALREAIVNTLIHADYSGTCSVLVVKRPDLFGFRNPGLLRIPREDVLRGGHSDCRNRNLQKMFQMVGLGEQAGSGIPKIYRSWSSQHWKKPKLEEHPDSNQTVLALEMTSLIPDEAVLALRLDIGEDFDQLAETERLAIVIAKTEGCVTHLRLKELTKDHPHDLSVTLHGLVEKDLLESDGSGRSTFYYLPGQHPIQEAELGVSAPPERSAANSVHNAESSVHNASNSIHNAPNSMHNASNTPEDLERNLRQKKKLQSIALLVSAKRRSDPDTTRTTIQKLCAIQELSIRELAELLQRNEATLRMRFVSPMCKTGILARRFPNIINHPHQKYHTAKTASAPSTDS